MPLKYTRIAAVPVFIDGSSYAFLFPYLHGVKHLLTLLLTIFYLFASAGVELKAHYCCGKLASVKIALIKDQQKCCCGKNENKGCCKTKTALVKVTDTQQSVSNEFSFEPFVLALNRVAFEPSRFTSNNFQALSFCDLNHSPPAPIYLAIRVLRI